MTARQELGDFGERVAAHRLEAAGMRVLARKVRTPSGEIDVVAQDGDDLVCVEVRARRADDAAASVTAAKLRRMWQCAVEWCENEGHDPERLRLDLVTVQLAPGRAVAHVEHLRGLDLPEE